MEAIRGIFGKRQEPPAAEHMVFADDEVYPVHLQDVNFKKLIMVCTLRFDHVLDSEKLREALSQLLETGDWRKLGGRLRHNAQGKLEIHAPKQFSSERPAVTFSHSDRSGTCIAQDELAAKLPVPTEKTSIQPNPYNLIDLGVRPDIPKTIEEMVDRDLPQISLHVVSFQDATLVSISWPHSVMDSLGFKHFLHAWSLVVSGKDDQVPPLLGAREDVLLDIEEQEPPASREKLLFQKHRLEGASLFMFILRYVWGMLWNPTPEVRSIFLPKTSLEQLQHACREEIEGTADTKHSFDEEPMLLAWLARFAAQSSAGDRPVTILNFFNARQRLSSMIDQSGVYVQNMVGYSFSFLSSKTATGSLGPLVAEHSQQIQQQTTKPQCLSFLRTYRRATQDGQPFKMFYGPSDAHIVGCNSLVNAELVGTVDFGAAAAQSSEGNADVPLGTMTCFYYHIMNNRLGCGPDCIYLLGNDSRENLWVSAALPGPTWDRIEAALEGYK